MKNDNFDRNKWQRNLFIEPRKPEPLWLEILGGISFVLFVLILCFV